MARVTVEDCVEEIPNRFDLIILSAERAKNISSGAPLTIERDNDKDSVVALREIAASNIDVDALRESHIISLQKNSKVDEVLEENLHAEKKDSVTEGDDYSESEAENDILLQEIDLGAEMDLNFSDDIIEEV